MIKDIQELNFPSYATMSAATVSLPDMGEWNITSQIKIDGDLAPDFSFDWEVVHDGHKYIMPLRNPQGSKENTTLNSVIDLTFQHWAVYQLKRFPFVTMQPIDSGTAVADEEVATPSLNLGDFCSLFGMVLNYYYGDKITLQLNPDWQYKAEAEVITISHTKVWNVLIEVFYKQFGVRWQIEPNGSYDKYVIKVGYPTTEQSHIFEYGFEGGLMKVERQVQSEEICNLLKGRGGEKNLPYRYFKNVDPENDTFKADPDWIEELKTLPFNNLMPATFRSYVQGWKAAHLDATDSEGNLLYKGYTPVGESNAYAPWAYRKGFTDTKFHPVEFVADEITIDPEAGDRQVEILPGYSPFVKKGSSLDKYGPLMNSLDNNEEIYPTIQGVTVDPYGRIDEVVAVEPITSDDIEEAAESDAKISTFEQPWPEKTETVGKNSRKDIVLTGTWFTVPTGKTANFDEGEKVVKIGTFKYNFRKGVWEVTNTDKEELLEGVVIEETSVTLESTDGSLVSASGIPSGVYRYRVTCKVHNTTDKQLSVTVALESPTLTEATLSDKWSSVWRIWVKNLWGTSKQSGETDSEYAERVWRPILGDRAGNEAKVVFASGMLAHEDYEFIIVDIPKYERKLCTWQTVENGQVVEHEYYSEWCIELGKNDAELETLGVYLPSVMRQAIAGDFFLFIGIDMPHQYTVWNEIRIDDDWKKPILGEKKDIKPTWVVQTDRVRLNNEGKEDALIRQLHPGDTLRLADKRFIEGAYETLYLSSLTITYREPTKDDAALNPDVEIVLSDRYEVSANPVATLQGEVSALAKQVGSISNVEQIVRAVGDKLYLRKDGLPDRSMSPTEFASLLTSLGFRSGMVGGAGWGIYKDANGNWVIEADRFMARQDLEVNNLVINQVTGQGGTIVESAARMEITRVEETSNGYKCYFDQHEGTVANLFHVDDVAWNNRYTPENADLKFYRRRVTEVGADYVVLSKTDVNGTGIPSEGDVIVQRGNYTDANRQFIKVRDVIGGGYERYIEGLDSVNAEGVQYYFVGRQAGVHNGRPYFFLGDENGFIEWVNGVLNIKGKIVATSTIGDKTIEQYIKDVVPPVTQEDIEGYVNAITKDKFDNLQSQIDGSITTFFQHGVPTLSNYPANEWSTNDEKDKHLGDLYYDKDTGFGYRFEAKDGGGYEWVLLKDTDIAKALAAAAQAQDTADGKRRVYTSQPTPPYDKGDLWVNATYGTQYSNDILRCVTAKEDGSSFAIGDWTLASKYTDDSALNQFISDYEDTIEDIQDQLDGKAETWYQPTDPSTVWNTADLKSLHKGDLWYNTANGTTWYWDGSQWKQQNVPDSVFDAIDGKADIFVSKPTGGYHKNDLWFLEADYTGNNGLGNPKKDYPQGTLMVATQSSTTFNAAHWAKKDRYTDDTLAQEAKDEIAGYEYLKEALKGNTVINGGLVLSSLIKLGTWTGSGDTATLSKVYAGMNGAVNPSWSDARKNKTIASFWGGDMVDKFYAENGTELLTPLEANYAAALVRMDGSAYFSKGNIGFDADGSGWLGNYENGIRFDSTGAMTFGSGIKVNLNGGLEGLKETLESLLNFNAGLVQLLQPCDAQNKPMGWAQAVNPDGSIAAKSLMARVGFWSTEYISTRGISDDSGSGGGIANLLTDWSDYDADNANTWGLSAGLGWSLRNSQESLAARVSLLEAGSGGSYVTVAGTQTIMGRKVFDDGIVLHGPTSAVMDWANVHGNPAVRFANNDYTQSVAIVFTDLDAYRAPAGLKIVGNQGNEWLECPRFIKSGGTSAQFLKADGSVTEYSAIENAFVKKSGDTMTGLLTISSGTWGDQLHIYRNNAGGGAVIRYSNAEKELGLIGIEGSGGTYPYDTVFQKEGVNYRIWHSGNDGSGSGLDADLLDGKQNGELTAIYLRSVAPPSDLNEVLKDKITYSFVIPNTTANIPAQAGWSQSVVNIPVHTNGNIAQLYFCGSKIYTRQGVSPDFSAWNTIAFTTDNVASATKIATARAIWGQSFSGEGNVDGILTLNYSSSTAGIEMTRVGGGECSIAYNSGSSRFVTGVWGVGNGYHVWNPDKGEIVTVTADGKVGIGRADATYTLDVNGDIYAGTGIIRADGQLQVGGNGDKFRADATGTVSCAGRMTAYGGFTSPDTAENYFGRLAIVTWDDDVWLVDRTDPDYSSLKLHVDGSLLPGGLTCYLGSADETWDYAYIDRIYSSSVSTGTILATTRLSVGKSGSGNYGSLKWDNTAKAIYTEEGFYSLKFVSTKGTAETSDMRLKRVVGGVDLTVAQIAAAPLFAFEWRDGEPGVFVGSSAQYWESVLPESVMMFYGYRNLFYGQTALAAGIVNSRAIEHLTARYDRWLGKHETRVQRLERENREMKARISDLEKEVERLRA